MGGWPISPAQILFCSGVRGIIGKLVLKIFLGTDVIPAM